MARITIVFAALAMLASHPVAFGQAYREDDLAEARAYIDAHRPELAGRLEAVPFRTALSPDLCRFTGYDLRTPGQIKQTP